MSFKVSNILQFPQSTLEYISREEFDINTTRGLPILGGILSDTHYVWHAKGPCLEVRNTKTGSKVGAWTFGCILKDSNTRIVCVEEIQRPSGLLSLLAIAIDCTISGGLICIFDVFSSKVIRAIHVKEKISSLHVVDSGCEVLNLPGPLRNFDGIISVGTEGGNVFLVDICRQICEEALHSVTVRDELHPCRLVLLTLKDIQKIEYYKELSMREGDHLAIHLNVVLNSSTHHFTLKGPRGEDRIIVNREEVVTSALYYCSQLTSLLVGFNFGAFQLWDLTSLKLVYTSPVCEEHVPITHFALQEPADDPRAFCYIWASYSNMELFQSGLPFAVMYSICYESKEYHEGYGYLYQDFQSCSIRFQVELGSLEEHRSGFKVKGGLCMGLQPICKVPNNKDLHLHDATGDILALCAISWSVWFSQTETQTYVLLFDLNQWYKEQMPDFTKWSDCTNYILKVSITDLLTATGMKGRPLLDVKLNNKSLRQFTGVQRLEEHFCPSALSFNLCGLRESDVIILHSEGLQKALLNQIEATGPLCLIRPNDVYRQVIHLGLTPLFTDAVSHTPVSTDAQREIILNVALEHQLVGWLCKCASEWANGSFSSAGCSIEFLINWAFQRAIVLKTHCDTYCTPLFDYSHLRLDNNTSILLNSCIRQINNLSVFYSYILNKLTSFISNLELVVDQQLSLKMVSIYFEVLQWLVNVGLLPECHPSTYHAIDNIDRVNAPYPVHELTEYYSKKRVQLQMLTKETFINSNSLLFIDSLVNNKCGAQELQKQWQEDGGSGLYPPPSLQSLLRTYLIEGTDISHKHSLIIYVFLDLAMALDQSKYASVITHLIKFPAVFKVSSSIIKITQAFWQLDHGDFTTAMEQLLDPFVLGDDLQPWHHSLAMRALLLQNQYNFALLYMQVRKPPITDEKDVLTAISLFIANNMLDEAFYFKNQHRNNNEEKLLLHLFNECNKNDSLHELLYRCLDNSEERAFFKYLRSVENPSCDDLQVFYYLLRSRFIEAFDTHQNLKKRKPECLGLIGQRNATQTDQIVRIFKTLLPDINKSVVDVVQRERANLWKQVARPTPLSVFVHDTNEQVQYKSTVIHAALAKAKHTFFDSPVTRSRDIVTEETPFLRTPKVTRMNSRHLTPIITPKIIEINDSGEELGPSPSKRLKLTPRASTSSPTRNLNFSIHSKMLTPIIKRKMSQQKDESLKSTSSFNVCTPQSILKIRNLVRNNEAVSDDTKMEETLEDYEGPARIENSTRRSSLGLLPRKSLPRAQRKPHVQFDDSICLSSSFSDQSIKPQTFENASGDKSGISSNDVSLLISSKNSSTSNTDEVFYSPNSSLNDSGSNENVKMDIEQNTSEVTTVPEAMDLDQKTNDLENIEDNRTVLPSPRARRSYKRSFGETVPVRYSPRITRHSSKENAQLESETTKDSANGNDSEDESLLKRALQVSSLTEINESTIESPSVKQSPRLSQKIKGRKSLSRKVLEHNTFSKARSSSSLNDTMKKVSVETSFSKTEKTVVTEETKGMLEVTTEETKEEITNMSTISNNSASSHRHSSRHSVSKGRISKENLDTDTSFEDEDEFSFSSPHLPDSLKMSESLVEYIKSRTSKQYNSEETPSGKVPSEQSVLAESLDELQGDADNPEQIYIVSDTESIAVYEEPINEGQNINKVSVESEAVQSDESKVDFLTNVPNAFIEVEKEKEQIVKEDLEKTNKSTPHSSFLDSDSFYVSESEKGFLGDHSKAEISTMSAESDIPEFEKGFLANDQPSKQDDVIEISSSSEEENSSKDGSVTSDSRSSEKSESDDELNIAYERNIHVEENSRSLVDSEDSRTSDNSANEDDHVEPPAQIRIEYVEEFHNDNELEENADSDIEMNNEQQSSDDNEELADDEEMLVVADEQNNGMEEVVEIDVQQFPQQNIEAEEAQLNDNESRKILPVEQPSQVIMEEGVIEKNQDVIEPLEEPSQAAIEEGVLEKNQNEREPQDEEEINQECSVEKQNEIKSTATLSSTTNQSTNTTILHVRDTKEISDTISAENSTIQCAIPQENIKVDQSTNTTVFISEDDTTKKTNDSVLETDRPTDRKTYRHKYSTMNDMSEDQTSSVSSDTTEGEMIKHEIVVKVDVHTPTKKKIEEPLIKRITRRSSALLSQTAESDALGDITQPEDSVAVTSFDIMDEDLHNLTNLTPRKKAYVTDILDYTILGKTIDSDNVFSPETRNRRSRSMTASPSRTLKSSRRSNEISELDKPSTSKDVKKETPKLRRTRSASVDEVLASPRRRSLRRSSTEEKSEESAESHKPKTRGKTAVLAPLPVIVEEGKGKGETGGKSKSNSVEEYTTTRRLTRRQASLVKDVKTPSSVTAQDDSDMEQTLDVDMIDPIILLDKEPFHGPPDPEEEKVYEPSSPSNSTASSFNKPAKRTTRSASMASDSSAASTSKKKTKQSVGQMDSPSPKGMRTRSRKQSETSSIASEKSDPPTPPKRPKRRHSSNEPEETGSAASIPVSTRSTRRRTKSISSVASDASGSSKRKPRNRRLLSAKSDLPEITEEKSSETGESTEKSTVKKSTRKKAS